MRSPLVFVLFCLAVLSPASYVNKMLKASKPKAWEAGVSYVEFRGSSPLIKFANAQILKCAKAILTDFEDNMGDLPRDNGIPYNLDCGCDVSMDSPTVLSVNFQSDFTFGGPHPGMEYFRMNFGLRSGRPVLLKASDVTTSTKSLEKVALSELRKELKARDLPLDLIQKLSREDMEAFVITPKGLSFTFAQGEITAWAAGAIDADVPWRKIKGLKRTGPLKAVIKA